MMKGITVTFRTIFNPDGDGGIVTVYIQPGQHSYDGTERNSVKSLPHGPSSLSFSFTVNGTGKIMYNSSCFGRDKRIFSAQ